jgi:hypothetical protein
LHILYIRIPSSDWKITAAIVNEGADGQTMHINLAPDLKTAMLPERLSLGHSVRIFFWNIEYLQLCTGDGEHKSVQDIQHERKD